MGDVKLGEPFGLETSTVAKIDWDLALKRIIHDTKSDFIFAPHLGYIYARAGEELIARLCSELKSGTYSPGVPLTLEVPKAFRIRVAAPSKRLGPSFSRPGSILLPRDRLFYQALADEAAPIVNIKTDKHRSFAHELAEPNSAAMFVPTRLCWGKLQKALAENGSAEKINYVLKIDVANCFGSLNHHTLINVLSDAGYPKQLASRLEALLTSYTGQRSSRGILQGLFPSDLIGNFYLGPIDKFLKEYGIPSARFVDDIFVFLENVESADHLLHALIPELRSYDLVLNEVKSVIMPKNALNTEEPDLESLFANAVTEISNQVDEGSFGADYGFQTEWDEVPSEQELELEATTILFDSVEEYPGHEENIERFCLPLFSKAGSDYAVAHVMESFKKRPSMSQMYSSYLAKFLDNGGVKAFLQELLQYPSITDWQRMWILAALSQVTTASDDEVKIALGILQDAARHEALRAVAAIFVGQFGDYTRRKALVTLYPNVSSYVQTAIYYSSRNWPGVEKSNAKANWGSHGPLNSLITCAMSKK